MNETNKKRNTRTVNVLFYNFSLQFFLKNVKFATSIKTILLAKKTKIYFAEIKVIREG